MLEGFIIITEMKRYALKYFSLVLLTSLFVLPASGQEKSEKIDWRFRFYPLVWDTFLKYPRTLDITGEIVQVSPGIGCGVLCDCGTIKIKPDKKNILYPDSFVYVALPCQGLADTAIHKKIKISLEVFEMDNCQCFYNEAPRNTIDSGKTPFYIARDEKWVVSGG